MSYRQLLDEAVAAKQVNGRKLQARYYNPWLDALRDWIGDPAAVSPDLKTGWSRLTPRGLGGGLDARASHPLTRPSRRLPPSRTHLRNLPDARPAILRHAARWVAERFAAEQDRRAQMGFNDLLTRLDAALQGRNGARLADDHPAPVPGRPDRRVPGHRPGAVPHLRCRLPGRGATTRPPRSSSSATPSRRSMPSAAPTSSPISQARRACAGRLYTLKRNYRSTHGHGRGRQPLLPGRRGPRRPGTAPSCFRERDGEPGALHRGGGPGRDDALHAEGQAAARAHRLVAACAGRRQAARQGGLSRPDRRGLRERDGASAQPGPGGAGRVRRRPARPSSSELRPADLAVLVNKRHGGRPHPPRAGAARGTQRLSLRPGLGLPEPPGRRAAALARRLRRARRRRACCAPRWPPRRSG